MSAGFLRPTDDDFAPTWTEDKVDIEPSKETTFVYNPNANWNLAGGLTSITKRIAGFAERFGIYFMWHQAGNRKR